MHLLCPHCHGPIELVKLATHEEIVCPSCGSSFRLESGSTRPLEGPRKLGKFDLLESVGLGAFGTVYKARDPALDRIVAVKVPRTGNLSTGTDLDRFVREARSVAQLRHPAIVPVYEVGQSEGVPYLVSEFVHGLTLTDWLTGRRATARESAELCAAIADALQYAHDQGVIHRDVKPSNIMLETVSSQSSVVSSTALPTQRTTDYGLLTPRLMDFGLAKRDAGEVTMTVEGQVLGTPAYMSPEQARGEAHRVDGRSDVYSLGVVLYQLLTGEIPFRGNARMLLHQVLHDEPKPPRALNDRIPRDLETVCVKCLQKEPGRRYATARELAEDLRRFLAGEAVRARPIGRVEKLWRWSRRKPAVAALLAAVLLLSLSVSLVSSVSAVRIAADAEELARRSTALDAALTREKELHAQALRQKDLVKQHERDARRQLYAARINLIERAFEQGNIATVEELLDLERPVEGGEDLRGFEWRHFWHICHRDRWTLPDTERFALTRDGAQLATLSQDGKVMLWETATGKLLATVGQPAQVHHAVITFDPTGKTLAWAIGDGSVTLWDRQSGQSKSLKLDRVAITLDFAPDGATLATLDSQGVILWDVSTGQSRTTLKAPKNQQYVSAFFSRDGQSLLTLSEGAVRVWDAGTTQQRLHLRVPGTPTAVAFSPDGKVLATATEPGTFAFVTGSRAPVQLWDLTSGAEVRGLRGHTGRITSLAFSPDGKLLVSSSDESLVQLQTKYGELKVWEVATGKELVTTEHARGVQDVAVSRDGKTVAIGCTPFGEVKICDLATGQVRAVFHGHKAAVSSVAFASPELLVTRDASGTVKTWEVSLGAEPVPFAGINNIAFSPVGKQLAIVKSDVEFWERADGKWRKHDSLFGTGPVAYLPKGRGVVMGNMLAALLAKRGLTVWDFDQNRARTALTADLDLRSIVVSPDGELLVGVLRSSDEDQVRVWELATGKVLTTLKGHSEDVSSAAFSLDGKMLATGSGDCRIKLWDTATWKELATLQPVAAEFVDAVAFSPDGRTLASAGGDFRTGAYRAVLKLWDLPTRKERASLKGHAARVTCLAFSPDGRTLASGSDDMTIKLWEPVHGRYLAALRGHQHPLKAVAFSADNQVLAGLCEGGALKLWHAASDAEIQARETKRVKKPPEVALDPK